MIERNRIGDVIQLNQGRSAVMPVVNLVGLGLAVWLLMSRNVLSYPASDPRSDATLNEILATIVVGVTAGARLVLRDGLPKMSALQILVGAWLMAAPFVVGYGSEIPAARTNALFSGALMIALGLVALLFGRGAGPRVASRTGADTERRAVRH